MFYRRNGVAPRVSPTARVAQSAQIVGDVTIGPGCFVDHNAVIESAGSPIVLDSQVLVLANAVVRSVGGSIRPAFGVCIGRGTLVSPLSALVGCEIGAKCYIATGAMIFHGAVIGDGSRVSAGAVVHTQTHLPPGSHVGLRGYAVRGPQGDPVITRDVEEARKHLAATDFFETAFGVDAHTLVSQNETALDLLRQEIECWQDEQIL
jgi:carbonic anhydrase/acetyltransferase-like protein (isoleucine patch superfamily)